MHQCSYGKLVWSSLSLLCLCGLGIDVTWIHRSNLVLFLLFLFCGIGDSVFVLGFFEGMIEFCTKLSGPGLFLIGKFLMMASISLGVMGMFRPVIWSWFKFIFGICLENCPFHQDFSVMFSISLCSRIWWLFQFPQFPLLCLPFHFWFCLFGSCLCALWLLYLSVYLSCIFGQRTTFWFCWYTV